MVSAFIAAVFFALSAVFAHRTTRLVGVFTANFARILIATGVLGVLAAIHGGALRGTALPIFLVSGVVGFGLGDLALFAAYPRLGSRLTSLLMQCLSSPFAAVIEWLWLGTRPGGAALICGAVILVGVGLAVAPGTTRQPDGGGYAGPDPAHRAVGLVFGVLAALGQAGGAVLSRKAFAVAHAAGQEIDGFTAAFQRALGGVVVIGAAYGISRGVRRWREGEPPPHWRSAWPWVVANALVGATIGVSFLQSALASTPSAVVLPIVALTPLLVVPFAYFLENERPSARSLVGGALAVAAAAVLAKVRQP